MGVAQQQKIIEGATLFVALATVEALSALLCCLDMAELSHERAVIRNDRMVTTWKCTLVSRQKK
jgi:hypothetical protein